MERLNKLLGFSGVLIFVISLFLLGNHNEQLPQYVKLIVPQKIQTLATFTTNSIDSFPWTIYQVISESGNILTEGSNELTKILQNQSDFAYDQFTGFVSTINTGGYYLAEGTIEALNQATVAKDEINKILLTQAGDMGKGIFIEAPNTIELAFLSPIEEKLSYAFIETRNYAKNEIAHPIAHDLIQVNTSFASE